MLLLAFALSAAVQDAPPAPFAGRGPHCPQTTSVHAWSRDKKVAPRKLNELPPANAYSAVYRTIAGCEVPVVVRYGVGGR
jgi:hypothetical protein